MMVMLYQAIVTASLLASINAVPLNINLGAYSPALVVGDGEISFGGGQDVSELMNTLEGAAVDAAVESSGEEGQARDVGVSRASVDEEEVAPALESDGAPAASGTLDPNLADQAAQIAALRGVDSKAKELDPRNPTITSAPQAPQKRDLAGFDRALEYAEAALTKGPLIQLGTGEGGSGVGIIVDNTGGRVGEGVAEEAPGVGGGEAVEKRGNDDVVAQQPQPQRRAKVTTMYIRRGISEGLSTRLQDRGVETAPVMNIPSIRRGRSKRDDGNNEAIDSINLNVEGNEGVTMTFVESDDEDADEEGA